MDAQTSLGVRRGLDAFEESWRLGKAVFQIRRVKSDSVAGINDLEAAFWIEILDLFVFGSPSILADGRSTPSPGSLQTVCEKRFFDSPSQDSA